MFRDPALKHACCHRLCWEVIVCLVAGSRHASLVPAGKKKQLQNKYRNDLLIQCSSCKLLINSHHANLALL